jgi:hypothetical protein
MKKNNWYFSYVERPAEELATLINNHKGICFFTTHGALEAGTPDLVNANLPICKNLYFIEIKYIINIS